MSIYWPSYLKSFENKIKYSRHLTTSQNNVHWRPPYHNTRSTTTIIDVAHLHHWCSDHHHHTPFLAAPLQVDNPNPIIASLWCWHCPTITKILKFIYCSWFEISTFLIYLLDLVNLFNAYLVYCECLYLVVVKWVIIKAIKCVMVT